MSYEIYYDRGFICVGDKFIPIACQGSNNCWEVSFNGREIPEKGWQVLNYKNRGKLLFTEDEIREIAADYERISQESGTCFKSRNRPFEKGEFERWILCGLKSAYTIEEYVSFGNRPYILDYSGSKDWKEHNFSTTDEFLKLVDELKGIKDLNVKFSYNRGLYKPKAARKKPKKKSFKNMPEYYVLGALYGKSETKIYFCSLTRYGFRYIQSPGSYCVKTFESERDAAKYLKKYESRLNIHAKFIPELVKNAI